MLGASRVSMGGLQTYLQTKFDGNDAATLATAGEGLLAIVDVLDSERTLRSTLADPAIGADNKRATVTALLQGKVSALALEVFSEVVTARWSSDADLEDAVEQSGATLVLMAAEKLGHIDSVEEELFRFGRAIDANPNLQMALTDPASVPAVKSGIVHSLLDGKTATETALLVSHVAGNLRGRRIQAALVQLSELAAQRRGRVIAYVRSAIALTLDQETRLAAALKKLHGKDVELNVNIDPSVVGGIEVRVGDEVIDGTASSKLEQARRRMTS